jgi:channel protein, hemolysin III family
MKKYYQNAREPMSSLTHLIGAILSFFILILMIIIGILNNIELKILTSVIIFGISLISLYSASAYYHYFPGNDKNWQYLRKLDHSMIYVLIAGSYTPFVISFVESKHALFFMIIIWSIALLGIIVKLCWMNAPRFLSTLFYLLMGWAIVFDSSAFKRFPKEVVLLIAIGGINYSLGAILYIIKKPNIFKSFGFHEIFHIFIMLGSLFHILAVFLYIL